MQKNVACWVFCVLFSAINSKWGVICQFSLRAPLWLVQLQYMVPVTLKVGQKYALDDFATDTCTHRTKSWPPGFYKDDLCAKTVYLWVNSRKQQAQHAAGHSLLHNLLTLTYIVLHAALNVHLGALSVQL